MIAETILEQLGGNKFRAMTGANRFIKDGKSLSFRLPKAKSGINVVHITLNGLDLYDIEFRRITMGKTLKNTIKATHNNIYFDQLQTLFTQETGLYTHL